MLCVVFFVVVVLINESLAQRGTIIPNCSKKSQKDNGVTVKEVLPEEFGRSVACQFTASRPASFLDIQAQKHSLTNESMRVSVYGVRFGYNKRYTISQTLGRLDTTNRTFGQKLVCLKNKYPKYVVIISGMPFLSFTVKVQLVTQQLQLGEEKTFSGPMLFLFSPRGTPQAQLDITVKSTDSGESVLRISHYCDQVESLCAINPQTSTMSLTFEEQARITVSKVSRPAFSITQPLFIGVLMQSPHEGNSKKTFTLKIRTSFNYNYTSPICFIILVPLVGGILVALWAVYCFGQLLSSNCCSQISSLASEDGGGQTESPEDLSSISSEMTPFIATQQPMANKKQNKNIGYERVKAIWEVLRYTWFSDGSSRAFSHLTCIVGSVLFVGVFQFVYENWNSMIEGGNRDRCFYNDFCYRVLPAWGDIPFNLMISNLAYFIHGIILGIIVWFMEAKFYRQSKEKATRHFDLIKSEDNQSTNTDTETLPRHTLLCSNINAHLPELSVPKFTRSFEKLPELYAKAYKRKYSFSVGYAFAWALIYEGIFSGTYHLCPTRLTFQFDTAFMFVIAGLITVSLFNGMSDRKCRQEEDLPAPVQPASFFLFAIVPLYFLNWLGSIYNVYHIKNRLLITFILAIWYVFMLIWAGRKLFYSSINYCFGICQSISKLVVFCAAVGVLLFALFFYQNDFSRMFLFSSIAIAVLCILGKIKFFQKFIKLVIAYYKMCKHCKFKSGCCSIRRVAQILYVMVTLGTMVAALYVFFAIPTTQKIDTPAHSRNLNKECTCLGFYDHHDIWHILSSFALLMSAFLVMYICD